MRTELHYRCLLIGPPYKYGGESRKGTDCSGLTMVVYRDVAGIKIPRNSGKQQEFCSRISRNALSPGDLVFFSSSRKGSVSHVGIYAGSGKFIHASSSRGVILSSLDEDYYRRHFHSAGRVPGTQAKTGNNSKDPDPIVETLAPRPFKFETVNHMPGREAPGVLARVVVILSTFPCLHPTNLIPSVRKSEMLSEISACIRLLY